MSDESGIVDRIGRGFRAQFVAQLLYIASNAALILLLTRVFLSPDGYGRLHFALSVLGVVSLLAILGLPKSTARYVTEYLETDPAQVRVVLRQSFRYVVVLAVGVAAALTALSGPLADWLGQSDVAAFLLAGGVYVVAYAVTSYCISVFQGLNRVGWSARLKALSGVARIGFAVVFIVAGLGAIGALFGYIAGYVLAAVVGVVALYVYHYRPLDEPTAPEDGLTRRLLAYSVPLTATKGAGALDKKVDAIIVGALLNPAAVGYYVLAKQVSDVLVAPAGSFGFALSPALGEQAAADRTDEAATLYQSSLRHVLLFYVPAATGLILVAEPTVRFVFGADYLPAVPVLQVFALYVVVHTVNQITSDGLDYLGRARSRAIAKGVAAVSNVLLNLALVPLVGVVGAAVATVITHTFYTAANVAVIHSELGLRLRALAVDTGWVGAVTVGMGAVVALATPMVSGPATFVAVVALGGAVWLGLSLLSGLIDPRQVKSVLL